MEERGERDSPMERRYVNKALRLVRELGKRVTGKMFLVKESSCAKTPPGPRVGGSRKPKQESLE